MIKQLKLMMLSLLRQVELSSVDSLTSDREAEEMTDVLLGLGLPGHLLVLPLLPRLLELSFSRRQSSGGGGEVVFVANS